MRVLILGGGGMLGHQLFQYIKAAGFDVYATLRRPLDQYRAFKMFSPSNVRAGLDLRDNDQTRRVLDEIRPDAIINATGIVKRRAESTNPIVNIEINSLLPHRMAAWCQDHSAQFIHFSTDCVFSGERGNYTEAELPDAVDIYGRSKLLGEVSGKGCLTMRTSMIGLELENKLGLVEWFLSAGMRVQGFRRAVFSGLTTMELSKVVSMLLARRSAKGIYHLSAAPIDKYDLLVRLRARLGIVKEIVPIDTPVIDRTLDSSRFRKEFSYNPPEWDQMLDELANDIRNRTNDISG